MMARKRTGSVRFRGGRWYVGMRLRSRRWHERPIDPPEDGSPYDETYAKLVAAQLARDYQLGMWDPEAAKAAPVGNPRVIEYVETWVAAQTYETAPKEQSQVKRYLARAVFGAVRMREVKPRDAIAWINWLKERPSQRGGKLSPSAVRNVYDVVQRAFDAALVDELLPTNPLRIVRKKHLPAKRDKHEGTRDSWEFTREEIEALIGSAVIKPDWRVRYALLFLTGMRFGETAALRWSDYNRTTTPLARLTVQRAIKSVSRREGRTKTGAKKLVPVHPTLAKILESWRTQGWRDAFGREPGPADYVIPSARGRRAGQPPNGSTANRTFRADQVALGLPPRHQHVARHAFITLAQDDGADGSVLRWVTHAPPASAFDGYTRAQWTRLCHEVAKLRIKPPKSASKAANLDGKRKTR